MLPLFYRVNKPFGSIYFLLNEKNRFFLPPVLLASLVIVPQHILVPFAYPQVGSILGIKCKLKLARIIENEEVGHHIAFGLIDICVITARLGIQLDDLIDHFLYLFIG